MISRIMFLMPEFPSHTHTWLWREICGLRENGLEVTLASTRKPKESDHAKHDFAKKVEDEVYYAWPPKIQDITSSAKTISKIHKLYRCIKYLKSIQSDDGPNLRSTLPLIIPAWRLARYCEAKHIQHIHSATPANSLILAQLVCIINNITCDVTVNSHLNGWGGALNIKFQHTARIFVVAQWIADQITQEFPNAISLKTRLARHGVDAAAWLPDTKRSTQGNDKTRVISVGRLHPVKGHDDLIKAVSILIDRGLDIDLRIAGSGFAQSQLEDLISSLGMHEHISLLGPLGESKVKELMASADIFVAASHKEPLGVVYMEAMASGLAVIGTNAGGAPEIIQDKINGILVEPKSPNDLADAIQLLTLNQELRQTLAANAIDHISKNFDSTIGAKIVAAEIAAIPHN